MSSNEHDKAAGLSTGAVARRLGVAPTTVRTWDQRYGLGPDAHTPGKHRRWTAADIARLERMSALTMAGVPPAEAARAAREGRSSATALAADAPTRPGPARSRAGTGLRLGNARRECKGLARASLRLDAASVDDLLTAAIDDYGLVTAWQEVIMPTLQAVGRKWEASGEKYVEVEHFLSWHITGALRRGAPRIPADQAAATTLLACVPGEVHTLPLEALAAALIDQGLPVRMFGAAMPAEALVDAVRRTGPAIIGLWAQSRTTANRPLAQHVAAIEWGVRGARRHPLVLTLGPGWAGQTVPGLPRPSGLAEALAVVEAAVGDGVRRPVGR
ncbi:MerR family transcriptional regulator [Streptomyces flavofungini]|uniref:MerR family transcriptional regulator n=1 Tax=Streptomyces flavofungini TaxID=68200 RepID=A0ABS0XFG7_9ACTN|nr:MerR family transcriptional regulator [Streptomyces flavofungini]MBJ3810354.1 MerR family transcriptional regulator [Streptomyces flavofungini]MBJ3811978.1 MerR family transcriptional regulator [Streptomyces flavofungini]GHC51156.1 transcriptional regulator [Streptomyces flavofungini]